MKILIAGANGCLAKYIRRRFSDKYSDVTLLSRTDIPKKEVAGWDVVHCDLSDKKELREKLKNRNFDVVINCVSQQPRNYLQFHNYLISNVICLDNLLDCICLNKMVKFIHFSSVVVYGNVSNTKIDDLTPTNPSNDYALTKLMSEQLLRCRVGNKGFEAYCFRLPSLHGCLEEGGIIDTCYHLARNNKTIEVYSQGKLIRNIMHYNNVVDAVECAINENSDTNGYKNFLLGSKDSLPMISIVRQLCELLGSHSIIKKINKKSPIEADWDLDINKAVTQIGFMPDTVADSIKCYVDECIGSYV